MQNVTGMEKMKSAIIIPARYGSTRFPGKPLALIAGQSMLSRVVDIAKNAAAELENAQVAVATEDERIEAHCKDINIPCIMTSADCPTGSDRVLEAAEKLDPTLDFVLGLQGDAPFTPKDAPRQMLETVQENSEIQVITPVVNLRWSELDSLRENKKVTPFSGTTAIIDKDGRALWFSKNILPTIRKEENIRKDSEYSPVYQHIGFYGFKMETLKKFVSLPRGHYETLEGLEQLRLLENDIPIHTVKLDVEAGLAQAGVDSPEDIARAEEILSKMEAA